MKKVIFFICVIAVVITMNSCKKRTYYYYGYCDKGHTPWEGAKHEYSEDGTLAETRRQEAALDAAEHDKNVHNGVYTAEVRNGSY